MCRRTTCRTCAKPTWTGCGAHVEQVLADVAPADRCPRDHTAGADSPRARKAWLARLLGR